MDSIGNKPLPISRKQNLYKDPAVPKPYKEIAAGLEKQFIKHMLEEMEKSVVKTKTPSMEDNYYQSMLTDRRAEIMSEVENAIGLKEIILEEIVPKHLKSYQGEKRGISMYNKNSKVQGVNE